MTDVLAIEGGRPIVRTPIKSRNSVTLEQRDAVTKFMHNAVIGYGPLSGYLAGSKRGGNAVQRLEDLWCKQFSVNYAVACNSGTSALLAAYATCMVRGAQVIVPTMGMSAAAAVPQLLGGKVRFTDVDEHFQLSPNILRFSSSSGRAIETTVIAINLFGRPCRLAELRKQCDQVGAFLIEDACQSLWATIDGKFTAGTAHFTCYSFNVHKPLNCGEGGMLVTNDMEMAERARLFINHGECDGEYRDLVGLNLRMTELTAVLALAQIEHSKRVVERCHEIHYKLSRIKDNGTSVVSDCYCLPLLAPTAKARDHIVKALTAEGVPCHAGYMLMHKLPAFAPAASLPKAEDYESRMVLIELCSIDPTDEQVAQMAAAIDTVFKSLW